MPPLLLSRRQLLRAAGLAAAALPLALRGMAFAAPGRRDDPTGLLLLVSLRGGMDGLHFLSPADDPRFVDLRAGAGLGTAAEGGAAGHRLDAAPDIDFRLHPDAAPLAAVWREGRMAIWPACGVPEPTRSHFEAQTLMGWGRGHRREGGAGAGGTDPGWLGAWADGRRQSTAGGGPAAAPLVQGGLVTALSAQGGLAPELAGARDGLAVASLAGGLAPPGGAFGEAMLEALYATDPKGRVGEAGRAALARLRTIDRSLARGPDGTVRPYEPEGGAAYEPAREFGRALAVVAETARRNPALAAATVDLGGWDTHDGQAGRLAERVRLLARGLDAFDRDMAQLDRRWTVLVASEFGRRLRPNRSQGTDHGRAGVVLAFGDPRFGLGRRFGAWPGLAPDQLEDGVDLRVATDYREAFAAVLRDLDPAAALPFRRGA